MIFNNDDEEDDVVTDEIYSKENDVNKKKKLVKKNQSKNSTWNIKRFRYFCFFNLYFILQQLHIYDVIIPSIV